MVKFLNDRVRGKILQAQLPQMYLKWQQEDREATKRGRKRAWERQERLDAENMQDRQDARRRLREQEQRERRRQMVVDREKDRALKYMDDIMARREEQISDLKTAPSTAMAAASMAYDKQAQNMAATSAMSGGRGFSRTGEQAYGDAMKTADANLMNATGMSVMQEKMARDSAVNQMLGQQQATMGGKAGIASGEGNPLGMYLGDMGNTANRGIAGGQLGLAANQQNIAMSQMAMQGFGTARAQQLNEDKFKWEQDTHFFNSILGLLGSGIEAGASIYGASMGAK